MFILTIRLKGAEAPIVMHYETSEGAEGGSRLATRIPLNAQEREDWEQFGTKIEDTFGHIVIVKPLEVAASFVTDVAKDCEAQVRCQMIAQRAQAELQMKLANDPALKIRQSIMGGRG